MQFSPKGLVTVSGILDSKGNPVSAADAIARGWIVSPKKAPAGWGCDRDEICLGNNLFVDGGRQAIAYLLGGYPNKKISQFQVGTGTTAANVADTALQNPVMLSGGSYYKAIVGVAFPSSFVAMVQFVLDASEANGYLLTEMGLFNEEETLIARKTMTGISKTSDFSPVLSWRLRC